MRARKQQRIETLHQIRRRHKREFMSLLMSTVTRAVSVSAACRTLDIDRGQLYTTFRVAGLQPPGFYIKQKEKQNV